MLLIEVYDVTLLSELLLCTDDEDDDIDGVEVIDEADDDELDVLVTDDMIDERLVTSYIEVIDEDDVVLCDDDEDELDDAEATDIEIVIVAFLLLVIEVNEYTQI